MSEEKALSLKDTIYKQIVEMICDGILTADSLITENQMIEHFKVSKSPVREALIQLCHDEVLVSIPRCGYQVVRITRKSVRDLTELRLYLELSSLPNVMDHLDEEKIRHLKNLNRKRLINPGSKTIWTAWNNNMDFHMTLVSYAENVQVNNVMSRTLATCTRAYAQLYNIRSSVIAPAKKNFHDLIVCALERHELYTAYEYLKKDILFMEQELLNTAILQPDKP